MAILSIMTRQREEDLKIFVKLAGMLFDARAKTLEININANTDAAIKACEARIRKDMLTKEDIKDMVRMKDIKDMATKDDIKYMATKDDIMRLEQKIDKLEKTWELKRQIVN